MFVHFQQSCFGCMAFARSINVCSNSVHKEAHAIQNVSDAAHSFRCAAYMAALCVRFLPRLYFIVMPLHAQSFIIAFIFFHIFFPLLNSGAIYERDISAFIIIIIFARIYLEYSAELLFGGLPLISLDKRSKLQTTWATVYIRTSTR